MTNKKSINKTQLGLAHKPHKPISQIKKNINPTRPGPSPKTNETNMSKTKV